MNKRHYVAIILLMLVMTSITHAASVKLSVTSIAGAPKKDVAVPITVSGAENLGAIEFDIVYDSAVASATKIDKGSAVSNALLETSVARPGRSRVAIVSSSGISGSGELVIVHFQTGEASGKTTISIENVRAWIVPKGQEGMSGMQHLVDAQTTVESGSLNVSGRKPMTLYIAGGLIVIIIAASAARKRRAR